MEKIVFFYKNCNDIPNVLRDYYYLAGDVAQKEGLEVYYINYRNDNIMSELEQKGVNFFDVDNEDYSMFENATFLCPLNYVFILLEKINRLNNAKIVLMNWQDASGKLFSNQLNVLGLPESRVYSLFKEKNAIANNGTSNKVNMDSLGIRTNVNNYVAIPYFCDNYVSYKEPNNIANKLNIAWVGEVGRAEVNAIINLSDNIMKSNYDGLVDIHIVGNVGNRLNVDMSEYKSKIRYIYTAELDNEEMEKYLENNIDLIISSEKSILKAGKVGIPMVISSIGSEQFYTNKYVFVGNTTEGTLCWTPANLKKIGYKYYSIDEIIEKITDKKSHKQIVEEQNAYLTNCFNKDKIMEQFLNCVRNSELTVKDLIMMPEVKEMYIKTKKYSDFMEYFDYMQSKYNINQAGTVAKIKSIVHILIDKCLKKPMEWAKTVVKRILSRRYYKKVQNSYAAKIENIKKIYEKEGKLKVAFLNIFDSVFPGEPVYERMLNDEMFDPYIIVIPDVDKARPYKDLMKTYNKTLESMKSKYGDRVIEGYNQKEDEYLELKSEYQILFFANPYEHLAHPYHHVNYFLDKNVLPLYICYGYAAVKYARGLLDLDFYNLVWKVYLESYDNYYDYKKYQPIKGKNAYVSGYIKMDKLATAKKVDKKRKSVLICPHHTVMGWDKLDISNFLRYSELFIKIPSMYPEIDFIFRPHPLLFNNLIEKKIWKQERLDEYMERLLANGNVKYDNDGDYFETFANSDGMIHDCGSFIGEYLYTEKPCCYMLKSPKDLKTLFLPIGEKCMANYYKAYNEQDIIDFIDKVIVKGEDDMKPQRERFCKDTLKINYPDATGKVIESIKEVVK